MKALIFTRVKLKDLRNLRDYYDLVMSSGILATGTGMESGS